jgi:predicted ATPase with chaperone activity
MRCPVRRLVPLLAAGVLTPGVPLTVSITHAQTRPQTQQQTQPSPGHSGRTQDITDQKLDAVAAALKQVAQVLRTYEQRIGQAPASEKQRITEEAKAALEKAVTDQGLSVDEYKSILVVAQNDSALREKIFRRIQPSAKPSP